MKNKWMLVVTGALLVALFVIKSTGVVFASFDRRAEVHQSQASNDSALRAMDDLMQISRELQAGDDKGGRGELKPGDDKGGQGEVEIGDDKGGAGELEPGDDKGMHFEFGDDKGGLRDGGELEPGDDKGGQGEVEIGDDKGGRGSDDSLVQSPTPAVDDNPKQEDAPKPGGDDHGRHGKGK